MSDPWTADRIRAYLLARPADADLAEAEERLLTDDVFARELEVAETELVDDFVAGRLGAADRAAFELIVTERPRLRERVAFARTLAARADGRVALTFGAGRTWLALAAAVALVAAGAWLAWRLGTSSARAPVSVEAPSPAPASPGSPPPAPPGEPERQVQTPPSPTAPGQPTVPAPPAVFAVLLTPGITRGAAPETVRVPAGTARVLFRVPIAEGDVFPAYRLTLRDESDRIVARADRLRPARERELQIGVDAGVLPPRAELHVEGLNDTGPPVDLAFLPLDVRK